MNSQPVNPASSSEPDYIWFPVRITAVAGLVYTFQEVWELSGGTIGDRIGGRYNTTADPAYAIDGSTFAVTAAGSNVGAMARRAPGAGGVGWELIATGGGSGPDATPTVRGWVSTTTQSFGGNKGFTGSVTATGLISGLGGVSTGIVYLTSGTPGTLFVDTIVPGPAAAVTSSSLYFMAYGGFYVNDLFGTKRPGLTTTFATGDGRTATFTGGILTGLA